MSRSARENIIFLLAAHLCWLTTPAVTRAEEMPIHPKPFLQAHRVAHGTVAPIGTNAIYLDPKDRCNMVVSAFGWEADQCKTVDGVFLGMGPDIDTVLVSTPIMDGHVKLDDWSNEATAEIDAITDSYRKGVEAQSKALGKQIRFVGWSLYPQIDRAHNVIFFATLSNWGETEDTLNIRVLQFDRYGYVPIQIVPMSGQLDKTQVQRIVDTVIANYKSDSETLYTSFTSGDKVATYGALGAFATALGVKYSKPIATGILAIAFLFLKKLWFLLLLPFVWIKNMFARNRSRSGT